MALDVPHFWGKALGKYGEAHYIAMSPRDEIFVADTLNWRVQSM